MSGESETHKALVRSLSKLIRERHGTDGNLALYCDDSHEQTQRPQRVGNHLPDVYAHDVPRTFVVLGEAKTLQDLETERSKRQLTTYIRRLSLYDLSYMYLAVPLFARPTANRLLREIRPGYESVLTAVITPGFEDIDA